MTLDNKRLDITDRVNGKLTKQGFELYVESESIGQVTFTEQGNQYSLKNGYEQEGSKIFQQVQVPSEKDAKYVDCDYENGWC
ncbi:MAG: YusG family protein [Bacillota bacterium]|uniref:YusG family protein n=1 Tax=Bacillus sp. RO2 TaxID=2723913 RepID=UPI00145C5C7A|nr:YusG family protein [Bacillus sp. RO2]MEA3320372.1 YusG family protein [Bacillota bacterium]NMH75371.1 YusG family protein [Bacillus sp. RO2]